MSNDTFLAHFWRYGYESRTPFDSFNEASAYLEHGSDAGNMSPVGVILPDGTEVKFGLRGCVLPGEVVAEPKELK